MDPVTTDAVPGDHIKKKHGTSSLLPTFCSKFMNRAPNGLTGEL